MAELRNTPNAGCIGKIAPRALAANSDSSAEHWSHATPFLLLRMSAMQGRKSTRASVPLIPRYRSSTGWEFVDGQCVDLSVGGMFIAAAAPLESGTLLKFECEVAGEEQQLRGVGRVVWQRTGSGERDRPSGMGLKFVKLEPGCAELIGRLVADAQSHGVTAPTHPLPAHYVLTESFPPGEVARASITGRMSVVSGRSVAPEAGSSPSESESRGLGRPQSQRVPLGTTSRAELDHRAAPAHDQLQSAPPEPIRHAIVPGDEPVLGSEPAKDNPLKPGIGAWLTMGMLAVALAAWVLLR